MDLASRHPGVEAAGGTLLTGLGTAIHFANDWLTPALSFFTALLGFIFAVHGGVRYLRNRKNKTRRRDDHR